MRSATNPLLDELIAELAQLLAPVEDRLLEPGADTTAPVVLVVGAPRSGTTLLTQWLADSGQFAVPTNLIARFSRTPALGARIQVLLTDPRYAFGDELSDLARPSGSFRSSLGKTSGALAPSEFAFFWRRVLGSQEIAPLGPGGIARADLITLRATFAQLEAVLGRPLAMKGMFVQFDLGAFAEAVPRAFFLHVHRDPVANGLALLEARERYNGNRTTWYSAKPPGYERLLALDPIRQVAGQVYLTEAGIRRELESMSPERWLSLSYEELCSAPQKAWGSLVTRLATLGCDIEGTYAGPEHFRSTTSNRLLADDAAAVAAALEELTAEER